MIKDKVFFKLFLGIQINSELRMHLNQSGQWKEAQILKDFDPLHLQEIRFQEERYIGKFLSQNEIQLTELQIEEKVVMEKVKQYCPNLKTEKLKVKIFPQQFIC